MSRDTFTSASFVLFKRLLRSVLAVFLKNAFFQFYCLSICFLLWDESGDYIEENTLLRATSMLIARLSSPMCEQCFLLFSNKQKMSVFP